MLGGEVLRHPQLQQFCWATGERSSRYSALCNVTSLQQQNFPKDHQIEWKDANHRGPWDRSNTAAPLAQPKWWAVVWLESKGRQLGRKQKRGNFHNFWVSLTRWDMLAALLLQCLAEHEKSPRELLLIAHVASSNMLQDPQERTRCHLRATPLHLERLCQGDACLVAPKACSLTSWPPKTSPGASPD